MHLSHVATHSSVLAWRIPGTGEPGGLPSVGLHRVRHDWSDLAAAAAPIPIPHVLNWMLNMFPLVLLTFFIASSTSFFSSLLRYYQKLEAFSCFLPYRDLNSFSVVPEHLEASCTSLNNLLHCIVIWSIFLFSAQHSPWGKCYTIYLQISSTWHSA